MAALLSNKFSEIAQWIEALNANSAGTFIADGLGGTINFGGSSVGAGSFVLSAYGKNALGFLGTVAPQGDGIAEFGDAVALQFLLSRNRITAGEASTFLSQKYPDSQYAGGKFADLAKQEAEGTAATKATSIPDDPEDPDQSNDPKELAESIQKVVGPASLNGSGSLPSGDLAIRTDDLPDEYDADDIQRIFDSMAQQVELNDTILQRGGVSFPSQSLPGTVIAPGSLPFSAVNPVEFERVLNTLPGPNEAIEVTFARSNGRDRSIVQGASRGPGRMLTASSFKFPPDWRPRPGPVRYRIIMAGMRLGVMSIEPITRGLLAVPRVRYGVVLHRLRSFLSRPPFVILAGAYVGEAPVPFSFTPLLATHIPSQLYHARARAAYQSAPKTYLSSYGVDPVLTPTAASLASSRGISASLITGRSAQEVYQQVNTRVPLSNDMGGASGSGLQKSGHGPSVSVPDGRSAMAPTFAVVSRGGGLYVDYDDAGGGGDPAVATNLIQGFPFSYGDCQSMVPSNTHYDLVLQLDMEHDYIPPGLVPPFPSPAHWAEHGVRFESGQDRVVAIDVILV